MSESSVPRPDARWGRKGALTLAALAALSTAHCGGGAAAPDEQPGSMPTAEEVAPALQPTPVQELPPQVFELDENVDVPAYGVSPDVMVPMYGLPADVPVPLPVPPEEGSADAGEGSAETAEPEVVPPSRSMPMPVYGMPPR